MRINHRMISTIDIFRVILTIIRVTLKHMCTCAMAQLRYLDFPASRKNWSASGKYGMKLLLLWKTIHNIIALSLSNFLILIKNFSSIDSKVCVVSRLQRCKKESICGRNLYPESLTMSVFACYWKNRQKG